MGDCFRTKFKIKRSTEIPLNKFSWDQYWISDGWFSIKRTYKHAQWSSHISRDLFPSWFNLNKFPTRQSFGEMLEEQFNAGSGKAKVSHWACCLEKYQDKRLHYHVSLKLTAPKKWLKIKNSIIKEHNVSVHFSDNHNNYIAAYRYVCKTDDQVFHSASLPDLSEVVCLITIELFPRFIF